MRCRRPRPARSSGFGCGRGHDRFRAHQNPLRHPRGHDLSRRKFARAAAHRGQGARRRHAGQRVGQAPHQGLERVGLDQPVAPHRRPRRQADRRAGRHRHHGRHAVDQGLPGAGRRHRSQSRPQGDPFRQRQLPVRPLHGARTDRLAGARTGAEDRRAGSSRGRNRRQRRGADADGGRLPHGAAARHEGADAERLTQRAR